MSLLRSASPARSDSGYSFRKSEAQTFEDAYAEDEPDDGQRPFEESAICKAHEIASYLASSGDKTKYNVAGHATQEIIL